MCYHQKIFLLLHIVLPASNFIWIIHPQFKFSVIFKLFSWFENSEFGSVSSAWCYNIILIFVIFLGCTTYRTFPLFSLWMGFRYSTKCGQTRSLFTKYQVDMIDTSTGVISLSYLHELENLIKSELVFPQPWISEHCELPKKTWNLLYYIHKTWQTLF